MTARNAARIMDLHVAQIPNGSGRCVYGAYLDETKAVLVVSQDGSNPKDALEKLVQKNFARVRDEAVEAQHWRCAVCARIGRPLSGHHIIPRSKGRRDVRENLAGVDPECHEALTNGGLKFTPHIRILDILAQQGWFWNSDAMQWFRREVTK